MNIQRPIYIISVIILSGCASTPDNTEKLAFECKRVDTYPSTCREQCLNSDPFSSADNALQCQRTCDAVQQNVCTAK